MKNTLRSFLFLLFAISSSTIFSQDYYFKAYRPFDEKIPSPEAFLGYPIGTYHTRYDRVVAYFEKLASLSDKARLDVYGKTNENRQLLILTITTPDHLQHLDAIRKRHLEVVDPQKNVTDYSGLPVFVELGYGVHGNEASSTEAAMLAAYTLIASKNPEVQKFLEETIIFIDPTINPDGRDRHTNWVNQFRGNPLIADANDIEHRPDWPYSRTNHYLFDLNRDLLLAVQPESIARLKWYHEWYPNVVTDFHEMGTSSTYFFEPKNVSASLHPVTPDENYSVLTMLFAKEFSSALDSIGSQYFYGERYDATYPGYGSTYMDLQGSLALLFEQASTNGHVQETPTGEIRFPFAIRNQYISSFATIRAAIKHKEVLYDYQNRFFKDAMNRAAKGKQKAYVFGDNYDEGRTRAFIDLLLKHKIEVYPAIDDIRYKGINLKKGHAFVVPLKQRQNLMVRSIFETYNKYRDSVFYDASAWSVVNFYNMKYAPVNRMVPATASPLTFTTNKKVITPVQKAGYAYMFSWDDYYAPAVLHALQEKGLVVKAATQPFSSIANGKEIRFGKGSLIIPLGDQKIMPDSVYSAVQQAADKFKVQAYAANTGFTPEGHGLGSRSLVAVQQPHVMMLVGGRVSAYEVGEVWHLFEQRMHMPIVKMPVRLFSGADIQKYNVIVMVSGSYSSLSEKDKQKLKNWVAAGNTLITSRTASSWVIKNKIVNEKLLYKKKDTTNRRYNYDAAYGTLGKQSLGGAIFKVDLDLTHPIAYGFHDKQIPVYKNSTVFLAPAKNQFSTVAKYTDNPHIDGYVTKENLDVMRKAASIIVSRVGKGRVVLFADNPNFRGAWYGTNKLFMNAVFFGQFIKVP